MRGYDVAAFQIGSNKEPLYQGTSKEAELTMRGRRYALKHEADRRALKEFYAAEPSIFAA
jgi:hypothetical protein